MEQPNVNQAVDLKRLKTAFYISIIGTSLLILAVVLSMTQEKGNTLFLGGGSVFILYYFLTTFPHIKQYPASLENAEKILSTGKKIAGYISIVNGGILILAGAGMTIFMIVQLFSDTKLGFDFSLIFMVFYMAFLVLYGWAVIYYVTKTFKLLKK